MRHPISTTEAGRILGVTRHHVTWLARHPEESGGFPPGERLGGGRDLFFERSEVEKYGKKRSKKAIVS
jgi:hypothetical protein